MDAEVTLLRVLHDLVRTDIEPFAVGGGEVVGLEAVGEREDHLAAIVLEGVRAVARAKRELEEVLLALVAAEVIRRPQVAGRDAVALDHAVVARDARVLEARALDVEAGDVLLDVGADLLLQ